MSIPMNSEDMQKLRLFVEFCSKNPTILNTEPLKFVKDFIEKFGGKVPEGEFKPAGGKCPFGGDSNVKTETPAAEDVDDSEEEPDASDPESELELDNEALYAKGARKKRKVLSEKLTDEQKAENRERIKREPSSDEVFSPSESENYEDDPLAFNDDSDSEHAPPVKTERKRRLRRRRKVEKKVSIQKENEGIAKDNGDETAETKPRKKYQTRRKRNPRSRVCSKKCKHECGFNFNSKRRKEICDAYWALSPEERKAFIRDTTKTNKIRRICIKKTDRRRRDYMTHYFLEAADGERKRVCVCFYFSTLSISFNSVKDELAAKMAEENLKQIENATASTSMTETPAAEKPIPKPKHSNKGKKLNMTRAPRPVNCDVRCRTKCTTKISEEQRALICSTFWAMDFKRRKDYILSRIESHDTITKTAAEFRKTSPRSHHNYYYLRNQKGENVRVCLQFFTATLSLSLNCIRETLRRTDPKTRTYIGDDMRGRKEPGNKVNNTLRDDVKKHIESYPTWAPQKRCKMRYLHGSLNIQKMYNEYKQKCIENNMKYVNPNYYRKVFHSDYRLAFLHMPSEQKANSEKRNASGGGEPARKKRKVNPNISEYTGDEGGFWTMPSTSDEVKTITAAATVSIDPNIGIIPQQYTTIEPAYPNYMQCTGSGNIDVVQQNRDPRICAQANNQQPIIAQYIETRYEQMPAVTNYN